MYMCCVNCVMCHLYCVNCVMWNVMSTVLIRQYGVLSIMINTFVFNVDRLTANSNLYTKIN